MKKHSWPYWLLLLTVLASALLIFFFSSQSGEVSNQSSDFFVQAAIRIFYPDYELLSSAEQTEIQGQMHYLVRKAAHFSEFALLGFTLRLLLRFHGLKRRSLFSWVLGTMYAATDELHQYFVGTRTAMVKDVLIDSAGVVFGCFLAAFLLYLLSRRKNKTTQ